MKIKNTLLKIKNYIYNDKKNIIISIALGVVMTAFITAGMYAENVSKDICDSVIRFHVIANSDNEYDQQLKLKVRDEILIKMSKEIEECKNREAAEKFLANHTEEITKIAEETIASEGYNYSVKTTLSNEHYPVRYYENAVFPEGTYESLRVIIGSGEGHNWWCVMYPPLCINGEAVGYDDDNMLKDVLSEESYEVVVLSENNSVPKMKLKIVELWSSINN